MDQATLERMGRRTTAGAARSGTALPLLFGLGCLLLSAGGAQAQRGPVVRPPLPTPPASDTMREGERVLAPIAFVRFCLRRPNECAGRGGGVAIALDEAALQDIVEVNRSVNRAIRPQRNAAPSSLRSWEVGPAFGDCNDYAVTKRHELLRRGYPAAALPLAVAVTGWGEDHLVLLVRTDRGDYVLDNLTAAIRPWSATGYRWIKRQSADDPNAWVSLEDGPMEPIPASWGRRPT